MSNVDLALITTVHLTHEVKWTVGVEMPGPATDRQYGSHSRLGWYSGVMHLDLIASQRRHVRV